MAGAIRLRIRGRLVLMLGLPRLALRKAGQGRQSHPPLQDKAPG